MRFRFFICCFLMAFATRGFTQSDNQVENKENLIYENAFSEKSAMEGWLIEGEALIQHKDGWMHMQSPAQESHHVYWCTETFPANFIAEWEVQNQNPEAGLCIIFFAAAGQGGQDLFDTNLNPRTGIFRQYTKSDINNYHISYYANSPTQKNRPFSHLRKNKGFKKVQVGGPGIAASSTGVHKLKLIKRNGHIQLFLDDKSIIDWTDNSPLKEGKIGFRQMKWTQFAYRNFKVWSVKY